MADSERNRLVVDAANFVVRREQSKMNEVLSPVQEEEQFFATIYAARQVLQTNGENAFMKAFEAQVGLEREAAEQRVRASGKFNEANPEAFAREVDLVARQEAAKKVHALESFKDNEAFNAKIVEYQGIFEKANEVLPEYFLQVLDADPAAIALTQQEKEELVRELLRGVFGGTYPQQALNMVERLQYVQAQQADQESLAKKSKGPLSIEYWKGKLKGWVNQGALAGAEAKLKEITNRYIQAKSQV